MSTDNPTRHMAQPELIRLGDRMLARAISTLFDRSEADTSAAARQDRLRR
jgi:hypothetical protein